jgi:hypothetical protein
MNFDERVDVIDMILGVLKEHEKNLDTLVSQLGAISTAPQSLPMTQNIVQTSNKIRINVRNWADFREKCNKPDIVAFDLVDDSFTVTALKPGMLFSYSETIPEVTIMLEKDSDNVTIEDDNFKIHEDPHFIINGKLQCGLPVQTGKSKSTTQKGDTIHKIIYDVDPDEARQWLQHELKVEKELVINGSVNI